MDTNTKSDTERVAEAASTEARTSAPRPSQKPAPFDLSALDTTVACAKPFRFQLKHPTSGAGTGIYFTIMGKHAPAYDQRVRDLADEGLRGQQDNMDSLERKNVNALVAAVLGWDSDDQGDGKVLLGGETLEFNENNVRKVLTKIRPARDQVQREVNNLGNWLKD